MRCTRCGAPVRAGQTVCPRCGRGIGPARPAAHLYRDRRRRQRRARGLRIAAVAAAALVLLALVLPRLSRRPELSPAPRTTPSPAPSVPSTTEAPVAPEATPTAEAPVTTALPATEAPVFTEAPLVPEEPSAPEETQATQASQAPTAAPAVGSAPPNADIARREDLIALYWWMIDSGRDAVSLDSVTLDNDVIEEVTDKFSNYFKAYRVYVDPPSARVEFKAGLKALHALRSGSVDALSGGARFVARQAQAAVAELIRDGMSDVEKEIALHDYILAHCRYQYDADDDDRDSAVGFFRNGLCNCTGYTDTFRLLGQLAGLEIEEIGGPTTRDAPGEKGHAWNLIRLDGLWYVVDPTWDDMVSPDSAPEYAYFNLPAAAFGDTRSFDASLCRAGDFAKSLDDKYYYYRPEYAARTANEAFDLVVRQLDADGKARLLVPEVSVARDAAVALQRHYGKSGSCTELSQDLLLHLYLFSK